MGMEWRQTGENGIEQAQMNRWNGMQKERMEEHEEKIWTYFHW